MVQILPMMHTAMIQIPILIHRAKTQQSLIMQTRKFQSRWLTLYGWLEYDSENDKMSCKICKECGKKNDRTFETDNFKISILIRHVSSSDHQRAVIAPRGREDLQKAVNKATSKAEMAIIVALKAVYWLVKEGLPLSKYSSLMTFLHELETPHISRLKLNQHTDYNRYNTDATCCLHCLP